jgi:hypothetical protein
VSRKLRVSVLTVLQFSWLKAISHQLYLGLPPCPSAPIDGTNASNYSKIAACVKCRQMKKQQGSFHFPVRA